MADARTAPLANSTLLLIRHAEKPDDGPGLAPAGEARARAYVDFFRGYTLRGASPAVPVRIDHIFAAADSPESARPGLTVAPLAAALGVPVDARFKDKDFADLAAHLLGHRRFADSGILVCWHHQHLLPLAGALGVDAGALPGASAWPDRWPDEVFGWLLQVAYDPDGRIIPARTLCLNERLTGDDRTEPPGAGGGV